MCMYPIIKRLLLDSFHRTTYKCLCSSPFIKKCIIQFDLTAPKEKVSKLTLCIPTHISIWYLFFVDVCLTCLAWCDKRSTTLFHASLYGAPSHYLVSFTSPSLSVCHCNWQLYQKTTHKQTQAHQWTRHNRMTKKTHFLSVWPCQSFVYSLCYALLSDDCLLHCRRRSLRLASTTVWFFSQSYLFILQLTSPLQS